jgi:hypothetical protein
MVIRLETDGGDTYDETVDVNMSAGEIHTFTTGYQVSEPASVLVTVDAEGSVDTQDPANNSVRVDLLTG